MTTLTLTRNGTKQVTFEGLKGLRAEGYIRDSTLDQRDGYGPELQRRAIESFAQGYGLVLGQAWYVDFITGTSTLKRSGFQQAIQDAQLDRFDVLLVYHTSRFARNRADAIRYKEELRKLGKTLVFVSQGIISGNDNDFLTEGINEVLDEQYARTISRFTRDGMWVKHQEGIANGKPPLGYKSEKLPSGKRERKVPDPGTMPVLLELLRCYASGHHSGQTLADHLNSLGYRNRMGQPFSEGSIRAVLDNRFYEGKVVYHPGKPDEAVRDGEHELPAEVKALWLRCQEVRRQKSHPGQHSPRTEFRIYPLTGVLLCDVCGKPYHGETVMKPHGRVYRRMYHYLRQCAVRPRSTDASALEVAFCEDVVGCVRLDEGWRQAVVKALAQEGPQPDISLELRRVEGALANLRKQHLWGAVTDEEFKGEFQALDRQRRALETQRQPLHTPNLDRAATLLADLPALWAHPGVSDGQRRDLGACLSNPCWRESGLERCRRRG